MKYKVYDWAGNDLTSFYGVFNGFEEAWGAIRDNCKKHAKNEEDYEEMLGEFYVEEFEEK